MSPHSSQLVLFKRKAKLTICFSYFRSLRAFTPLKFLGYLAPTSPKKPKSCPSKLISKSELLDLMDMASTIPEEDLLGMLVNSEHSSSSAATAVVGIFQSGKLLQAHCISQPSLKKQYLYILCKLWQVKIALQSSLLCQVLCYAGPEAGR